MDAVVSVIKAVISWLCSPGQFFVLMSAWCVIAILKPEWWVKPKRFAIQMSVFVALYIFSLTDANFRHIALKGDNIPIILMLFLLVYFAWLGFYRGYQNDERRKAGRPLIEEEGGETKVLVWPHLLYIEFIVGILVLALLFIWAVAIPAPLEEPASSARTPNPSKAPWYFLGLQEMLVYFDPWMAGVIAPTLIIVGLCAIPYLDRNKKGNGYYTIAERRFSIFGFSYGFFVLWIALIFLGTILRGPNWNFFGPYEFWDLHKQPVLNNLNLSELVFVKWMGSAMPVNWIKREALGIVLVFSYLFVLPVLLTRIERIRRFRMDLGAPRYYIFMFLFLSMFSLPVKMILRWTLNLKYVVAIPEYFFNI